MAYSSNNKLRLIADIQNITLEYKGKGCTQEWIFRKLIKDTYHISRSTYYQYLACAAKMRLKRPVVKKITEQG